MSQSDGQMYNPPQMAHNYQPLTQPGVQTAVAGPSPRSPDSNNGQHIGVQTYPRQQYQTQPSGQYQGQAPNYYQPQPMAPQQQWQPPVQQPMPQSYSSSAQIPVQVVYQQSEDPDLDCKIMAYKVLKWVQVVFVCIELSWIVISLFLFESKSDKDDSDKSDKERWYANDPKVSAFFIGVCDAFGVAVSLLDSPVCQIIHFIMTFIHALDLKVWFREIFHFCIALVLMVFMCLGWNELERNRRQRQN